MSKIYRRGYLKRYFRYLRVKLQISQTKQGKFRPSRQSKFRPSPIKGAKTIF